MSVTSPGLPRQHTERTLARTRPAQAGATARAGAAGHVARAVSNGSLARAPGRPARVDIRRPEDDKLIARGQVRLQNIEATT
ncbi:MAG TPA: hypothetical protein VG276_10240 [Actinomycetes bacterium]|jgi:hypothetical protein|nr:hypothetical protein [Actinomycetes bacterium]